MCAEQAPNGGTAVNEPFVGADDKLANGALLRVAV